MERWKGVGPIVAIVAAYLLCLVGDWPLATIVDVTSNSWLGDRTVTASFGLTAGHFMRPGLIVLIVWALSLDSKIGRASGRERVCMYVENSVVAVSLKKKNNNNKIK